MATEVSPKSNRLFIVIGVILAIVAFGLVLFITKSGGGGSGGQTQNIVVAKSDLQQGVALTADMLTTAAYPAPVPADSVADTPALVGRIPSVPIKANSPITQSVLVNPLVTPLGNNSLTITKGDVALAIPTAYGTSYGSADLQNVGNYVQPEDHIDIMVADGQGNIRFSFQDVRVLRVGVSAGASAVTGQTTAASAAAGTPTVLIIELPRNQAELMTYLITRPAPANGSPPQSTLVKYVLRPRDEYGKDKEPPNYVGNVGTPMPTPPDNGAGAGQLNALFAGR